MCYACTKTDSYDDEPITVDVILPDADGMQYRTGGIIGYWKDVEKGQTSFEVPYSRIEFRKKPKMVATVTYPTNTAVFYDEESLKRAIEINLRNGAKFDLKVEWK